MGVSDTIVHPDYQRSVSDIYIEACQGCLNASDIVRLLCSVDHDQPSMVMPSWVPDWSMPRQTTSLGYPGKEHAAYKAATWDANFAGYRLKPLRLESGTSLVIEGFIFDFVSNTYEPAGGSLQDLLVESTTKQCILNFMDVIVENCKVYATDGGVFRAFWNTLVAGTDHTGVLKALPEYAEIFALLLDTATGQSISLPNQPTWKRKLTIQSLESRRPRRTYRELQIAYKAAVRGGKFGTTGKGYMGLFPRGARSSERRSDMCLPGGTGTFCSQAAEAGPYVLVPIDGRVLRPWNHGWRDSRSERYGASGDCSCMTY